MEKLRKMDQQAEKDKTERVTGLGRRTREEIAKWNQMTALRFQTGRTETLQHSFLFPASLSCGQHVSEDTTKSIALKLL